MNTVEPMYGWEDINWAKVQRNVLKLQTRIYRASERGDVKAVRKLQRLLTHSWDAKLLAVRNVSQNNPGQNTGGIAGVKKLSNPQKLQLATQLRLNDKSEPPQRGWIPKRGIPTMMERAKQALVKLALEPEWEAKFEANSYGFRPGRSAHDAIAAIDNSIGQQDKYVLNAHIEKCFDPINHQKLLDKLNTFPQFRRQIKAWLKSGLMDSKHLFPTAEATRQGAVISPLLGNIALHGLEEHLNRKLNLRVEKGRKSKVSVIRYADDFVILDTELTVILKAKQITEAFLGELGLKLSEQNTQITHTFQEYEGKAGFDFLGFNIRQYPCSDQQSGSVGGTERKRGFKTIIKPSKEAIKQHLNKIDEVIARNKNASQEQLINALNPIIRDWTSYYATVSSSKTFSYLTSVTFQKLRGWAMYRAANHQNKTEVISKYWGVNRGLGWKFITPDNKYTLRKHQETSITRHIKVKGNKSPFDGDYLYWGNRLSTQYCSVEAKIMENATCHDIKHNHKVSEKTQVIEEPCEIKVSCTVLKERYRR